MNSIITGPDKLNDEHIFHVHEFCLKCKKLNYENNDSLKTMKWTEADWFAHFLNDKIVSLSGVHKFLDGFRVMFRGATLPGTTNKLLNKEQAYAQMNYIGKSNFYFTLNISHEHGAKSNRLRKWVHSGRGWPGSIYIKTQEVYGVKQEIWKI